MRSFRSNLQNEDNSHYFWPLRSLRLVTSRLELRPPAEAELDALAALASTESYDPSVPPLAGRQDTPAERGRRMLQHHWHSWASWTPARWSLDLAVFERGRPVGIQNMRALDFPRSKEVETGWWIHRDHQSEGLGTLAHAMFLHFAFKGLRVTHVLAEARKDNTPVQRVLRKFGYLEYGSEHEDERDRAVTWQGFRLTAEQWHVSRPVTEVSMRGLEECLPMFGIPSQDLTPRDQITIQLSTGVDCK